MESKVKVKNGVANFGKNHCMNEIDDLSSCSVCLCEYDYERRIAKFLPCFHTFCLVCLQALSSSTVLISCPLCRSTYTCTDGVENCKTNVWALCIAKMCSKSERMKHQQDLSKKWCLTCEAVANSTCCAINSSSNNHAVIALGTSTIEEAENLQKLIKEIRLKQINAIEKTRSIQAHLLSLKDSLKLVELQLQDQIANNELHMSRIVSLDAKGLINQGGGEEMTISVLKDSVMDIASQFEECLKDRTKMSDGLELQKKIRILLHLRDAQNQPISTFSLFEDGFYSNWTTTEELSADDCELMMMSHLIFSILKRYNISLKSRPPTGSYFTSLPVECRPRPLPMSSTSVTSLSSRLSSPSSSRRFPVPNEITCTSPSAIGSSQFIASSLSYSQVLNLPKPSLPTEEAHFPLKTEVSLPVFSIRFGEKSNPRYNVPSKNLGEVVVQQTLSSHIQFTQQLIACCRKPQEIARSIMKASPGLFVAVEVENTRMLEELTGMTSLIAWEGSERSRDAYDVGINAIIVEGKVVAWKLMFLIDDFKPNNMENTMLFGKVVNGKDILRRLATRVKRDRCNLQITMKTV